MKMKFSESPSCHLSEPTTTSVLKSYFSLPISMHCGATYTLPGAFGLMTIHQRGQIFLQTAQESDSTCRTDLSLSSSLTGGRPAGSQWALSSRLPLLPCPFILHRDLLSYPILVNSLQSTCTKTLSQYILF